MKAMSKFFLIVAGIISVVGCILLALGAIMANKQGVLLFPKKEDGRYVYKVDLTDTDISKIQIDATDADITVYTNQESEYIEFINFNENYYSLSTTNRVVSFDEYVDFTSMISFWDSSFSFKGIRSIFSLGKKVKGAKEVNVYLSPERDINIFDLGIENGRITISDISTDTDYKFTLDKGTVSMKNISTTSTISITANECRLECENCSAGAFDGNAATMTMSGDLSGLGSFDLNAKDGTVTSTLAFSKEKNAFSAMTNGTVLIDGESVNTPFRNFSEDDEITDEYAKINFTGETLNIDLTTSGKVVQKEADE